VELQARRDREREVQGIWILRRFSGINGDGPEVG
jgi:hypothetical protein